MMIKKIKSKINFINPKNKVGKASREHNRKVRLKN